jgi:hypothetical protein
MVSEKWSTSSGRGSSTRFTAPGAFPGCCWLEVSWSGSALFTHSIKSIFSPISERAGPGSQRRRPAAAREVVLWTGNTFLGRGAADGGCARPNRACALIIMILCTRPTRNQHARRRRDTHWQATAGGRLGCPGPRAGGGLSRHEPARRNPCR